MIRHLILIRWLLSKIQKLINTGKEVEKLEPLHTVGRKTLFQESKIGVCSSSIYKMAYY